MDAFQHVNNTVYFRYFEDVRIEYFERVGINASKAQHNLGPIIAKTECSFKLPLKFPDKIQIATKVAILSEKKFNMDYVIFSETHQAIAAEGSALVVFYDYNQGKSCVIPDEIVNNMNSLQP